MKKLLLTTLTTIALSSISTAHAEGAYVGADVLFGHYGLENSGVSSWNGGGETVSGRVLAGYNFNSNWAIEGGYADFGSSKYNFTAASGVNGSLDVNSHAWYVAAKGSIPINETFSLYGKLGLTTNNVDRDGTGPASDATQRVTNTGLYAGIGAQYKLSEKVAVTLELEHFGQLNSYGNDTNTILISTGVRYSF